MTNTIPLIQLAAQHAGYDVSGAEIGMALTAVGAACAAVTHAAHLAVNGWRRVGGWEGFVAWVKTGQ
jgi:hypothetical protein